MRIACPACAAAYEVPDRLLAGAPRLLRCARCGASFSLPAQAAPAPAEPPAEPEPTAAASPPPQPDSTSGAAPEPLPPEPVAPEDAAPPAEPAATPAPEEPAPQPLARRVEEAPPPDALAWAWAASVAVVVLGALALVVFRARVMEAWPPSTRLFAALGLS